ncbi:MAG: signal peptide peptidase SppA [Deltaproteobacteria bacterium]|nr:signal peptide peptidase SppA [Deltaproteobacteria bacterium]
MKKISALVVSAALFLTGCVFVNLPAVTPLVEKTIGGSGADKVLIVDISGVLTDETRGGVLGIQTEANLTARIKEELTNASGDRAIKAVVLRINTPGGSVTTCDIISHEINNFRKQSGVKVVAELMDVATSGGYYIASSADRIVAHPTTVTGSIGVVAFNLNASGLMEKIGVTNQTVKSGDKKDMGSPFKPMTEEERRILQSVIDGMYERFLDVAAEGRKGVVSKAEIRKAADGRIYTAQQALDLKLIDSVGYLDDAVEAAKGLAGIKEARLVTYAGPRDYRNNIYSSAAPKTSATLSLINIDPSIYGKFGMNFMYVWMP